MNVLHRRPALLVLAAIQASFLVAIGPAAAAPRSALARDPAPRAPAISWQPWGDAVFQRAAQEHKFVLLELEAVWCHWCHVMDRTTWQDPAVRKVLAEHYVTVRVDQDAAPALSTRYQNWGWPALIVFAADGSEIVKRRGYLPHPQMQRLLRAIVQDPSPGPSVDAAADQDLPPAASSTLDAATVRSLRAELAKAYDADHAGFGEGQKLLDDGPLEVVFAAAQDGDAESARRAHETLAAALALQDPVWGGFYQYSATPDWRSPHTEKLLSIQAQALRLYAQASVLWQEPRFLSAAQGTARYLQAFLESPGGGFHPSQDADASATEGGPAYFALNDAARRRLGTPRVDPHVPARDTGWAIEGLAELSAVDGDPVTLAAALRSARWVLANRTLAGAAAGTVGFRHDERAQTAGGAQLADTLAMGKAFLALAEVTGDPAWLAQAEAAGRFIEARFATPGGFQASEASVGSRGVLARPVVDAAENVAFARFAIRLWRATGAAQHREAAELAIRSAASPARLARERPVPTLLLAAQELAAEPLHIAVAGPRTDSAALALHRAALRAPAASKRVEFWDPKDPRPAGLPDLPGNARPAAYVCTRTFCSRPAHTPEELARVIEALPKPPPLG